MTTTIYALTSKQGTAMSETVLTAADFTLENQERVKASAPIDWDGRGFSDVSDNEALQPEHFDEAPATIPTVTVFSKNDCPLCDSTVATLEKSGVPYRKINVEEDTTPRDEFGGKTPLEHVVTNYGRSMPAVVVETGPIIDFWLGARIDKLVGLKRIFAELDALIPEDQRPGRK